jgi:hypothetical protein
MFIPDIASRQAMEKHGRKEKGAWPLFLYPLFLYRRVASADFSR